MREFRSLSEAQKWLDVNRPKVTDISYAQYGEQYGRAAQMCVEDCFYFAIHGTFTQLKMAARRLSNALTVHHPEVFESYRRAA